MRVIAYKFNNDTLCIKLDVTFTSIKVQKLEYQSQTLSNDSQNVLKLDCDFIEYTFSKEKSEVTVSVCEGAESVIIIIRTIDGKDINEAVMINKSGVLVSEQVQTTAKSDANLVKKNENGSTSSKIHATIRRKLRPLV